MQNSAKNLRQNWTKSDRFDMQLNLQLSHIELVNRFSKAVFFGNNQEYLVGLKEEQERVTFARQLIQNTIIYCVELFVFIRPN
jgi:hypothetical protein